MRSRRLGESLIILQELPYEAAQVAYQLTSQAASESWNGFIEAVPAFNQVGVYFDPDFFDPTLLDSPSEMLQFIAWQKTNYVIPILIDGPDIDSASQQLQIDPAELMQIFCEAVFTVEAIGFCPGFPYLSGFPPELQGLSRLESPRAVVPPGSIAIVGDQACIYPQATPGGWNIIGRTPLVICDPDQNFFPLHAGDTIRFQSISASEFNQMEGNWLASPST